MIDKIETTTEFIESKGGLILAGKIAKMIGLGNIICSNVKNAGNIIKSLFALMIEGKTDFESMNGKRESLFFKEALDLAFVYAKETIRLYLEKMAVDSDKIINQLKESAAKIIKISKLHGIWIEDKLYIPVDGDTTVMDNSKTKKEGVSYTYRGFDGYQPMMAYIGKEGYILNCELRPGSQHCQSGMDTFIWESVRQLEKAEIKGRILFRLDSGNDAYETMEAIIYSREENYCIIKRNKRRESDEKWLEMAKLNGKLEEPRKGKKIWRGITDIHPRNKRGQILEDIHCVYEVIERTTDYIGNELLIPEIEVNSFWTNLTCEAEKVIELYHDHGTSEQFHSELKNDLGVERMPSGKFKVNEILLAVAMNAYNTLRYLGQQSIEKDECKKHRRKRLGKVIIEIICVAGKLVKHAKSLVFKIYEKDPILPIYLKLNTILDCM